MIDILRWETRKTRKPHCCWGCGKIYPEKSGMVSAAYADGGSVFDCYWCETCVEYMRRYYDNDDDVCFGGIYDNDSNGWNELKGEINND